ncbi:hypothetical protein Pfo_022713 [Paulownia fortunei]|nr:hypothetical protein Pfo_022713 [Paulownia fortunei]
MGSGKKKIKIRKKEKESDRMVTFSKRRKGLFKKAAELRSITGAHVAILVFSPAGRPYVHGEPPAKQDFDDFDGNGTDIFSCYSSLMSWLDILEVDECETEEELVLMKNALEKIKNNILAKRIGNSF